MTSCDLEDGEYLTANVDWDVIHFEEEGRSFPVLISFSKRPLYQSHSSKSEGLSLLIENVSGLNCSFR